MKKRRLGREGLEVAEIGLGCMGMSEFYGSLDESESFATIQRALELGVDFFDTADIYGPFTNEQLLGRALRGKREGVIVATKFGSVRGEDGSFRGIDGRPEYVKRCAEASLQRLGIDHIDLYYQHRVDPKVPIEDTVPDPRETLTARRHSTTCVGARAHRRTTRPPCRASRQHSPEVANADRSPVRGRERC